VPARGRFQHGNGHVARIRRLNDGGLIQAMTSPGSRSATRATRRQAERVARRQSSRCSRGSRARLGPKPSRGLLAAANTAIRAKEGGAGSQGGKGQGNGANARPFDVWNGRFVPSASDRLRAARNSSPPGASAPSTEPIECKVNDRRRDSVSIWETRSPPTMAIERSRSSEPVALPKAKGRAPRGRRRWS